MYYVEHIQTIIDNRGEWCHFYLLMTEVCLGSPVIIIVAKMLTYTVQAHISGEYSSCICFYGTPFSV